MHLSPQIVFGFHNKLRHDERNTDTTANIRRRRPPLMTEPEQWQHPNRRHHIDGTFFRAKPSPGTPLPPSHLPVFVRALYPIAAQYTAVFPEMAECGRFNHTDHFAGDLISCKVTLRHMTRLTQGADSFCNVHLAHPLLQKFRLKTKISKIC